MDISVRYLPTYMITYFDNGGFESVVYYVRYKLLISDTILRSFIPSQVHKMTPKLRQICGCDHCIITKDMYIDLNRFRKILVTYLQHNYVGRYTYNIIFSTTTAAHHKYKLFPDGECLHATIKYFA